MEIEPVELKTKKDSPNKLVNNTLLWKVSKLIRICLNLVNKSINNSKRLIFLIQQSGGKRSAFKKIFLIYKTEGYKGLINRIKNLKQHSIQPQYTNIFVNSIIPKRLKAVLSEWNISYNKVKSGNHLTPQKPITISVVTHNSERWIPRFFQSLEKQLFPKNLINLFIVDHESTDETLNILRKFKNNFEHLFGSVKIIRQENKGFGAGHHAAIQNSVDPFVLVTNIDLEFNPNSIIDVVSVATADESNVASWELRQCPFEHPKYYDPITLETSWSSHACVLIRRSAYQNVGGYEPRIFLYGEDAELSYRFRSHGYKLKYIPIATVTHHVDLTDVKIRPLQLSGSISSNILNRYRYGSEKDIAYGNLLLSDLISSEQNPNRKKSFIEAQEIVQKNSFHFQNTHRPNLEVPFPFSGFDYDIRRDGHDIHLTPVLSCDYLPKVSIVTRTYGPNTSSLKETIVSVLNQTYRNIEYIIVEDRTDYAENLILEINSKYETNIRYFKSDGIGRSRAGNFGLENSTGDHIMFLDDDDLIFSDHVELLSQYLVENKKHVSAYSLAWEVKTINKGDNEYEEVEHIIDEGHKLPFSKGRLQKCNFIPIQSILFKRQLYEKFGGFDESLDYLEDWNLWVRYSQGGDFLFVPKLTSLYRTPAENQSRIIRQNNLDRAYDDVLKRNLNAINQLV